MKRKAFTIVEVLAAVAILALFVAMLAPSLSVAFSSRRADRSVEGEIPLGSVSVESNEGGGCHYVPLTAINVVDHGNGWWEFTLNGNSGCSITTDTIKNHWP